MGESWISKSTRYPFGSTPNKTGVKDAPHSSAMTVFPSNASDSSACVRHKRIMCYKHIIRRKYDVVILNIFPKPYMGGKHIKLFVILNYQFISSLVFQVKLHYIHSTLSFLQFSKSDESFINRSFCIFEYHICDNRPFALFIYNYMQSE